MLLHYSVDRSGNRCRPLMHSDEAWGRRISDGVYVVERSPFYYSVSLTLSLSLCLTLSLSLSLSRLPPPQNYWQEVRRREISLPHMNITFVCDRRHRCIVARGIPACTGADLIGEGKRFKSVAYLSRATGSVLRVACQPAGCQTSLKREI